MTRNSRWMALCAFVFGLGFAASAVAACNTTCLNNCKTRELNKCLAAGGGDWCYQDDYGQCYRPCGCIIP